MLLYGRPAEEIEIDDRALTHLKSVMLDKLRRGQSFVFSFEHPHGSGDALRAIWIHPTIPLQFKFYGSRRPSRNRSWLELLMVSANSVDGLRILPEPLTHDDPSDSS